MPNLSLRRVYLSLFLDISLFQKCFKVELGLPIILIIKQLVILNSRYNSLKLRETK